MAEGMAVLEPAEPDSVGDFPFGLPVHVITAYNPAAVEGDEDGNERRHASLTTALSAYDTIPSVGSARDGSLAEPGFGVLDITTATAVGIGRSFGQIAIYRWSAEALTIVAVDDSTELRLGWSLTPATDEPPISRRATDGRS